MSSSNFVSQLCRAEKSVTRRIAMGLAVEIAVDDVERRVGDYHSNLWDDDFIQSLSTPYGVILFHFNSFFHSV